MTCRECGAGLATRRQRQDPEVKRTTRHHMGRGLCEPCYMRARRAGVLVFYERPTRPYAETIAEWHALRAEGHTIEQAAPRLGMKAETLRKAIQRGAA